MCLPVHLVRHQLLSCENSTKAKNKSVHYISQTPPPPPPPPCDHVYSRTSVCLCSERAPVAKFITRCSRARQLISMCWLRDRYVGRALEECARYLFSEKQRSRQGRKTCRRPTTTTARSGRPTYMHLHVRTHCTLSMGIRGPLENHPRITQNGPRICKGPLSVRGDDEARGGDNSDGGRD